jgi:DNA-binding response OmpR family regulator
MPNSAVRELRQAHPISSDYVTPLGPFVLFGSDDPTVTSVGTRIFRGAGYRVRAARVELLTTRHLLGSGRGFPGEGVELVVLDASKQAERALAVLEALRGRDATVPVILIAGSDPGLRDEAARLGADALVDVPLEMTKLRGLVEVLTPFVPDFTTARTNRSIGRPH